MESKKVEFFNRLSFITLLSTVFISLFFFIPYISVSLIACKGFLISVGTILSLLFWLIARLGEGKFIIPKDRLILFAGIIPLIFLISSFFSSSLYASLFGSGFEIGTFGSMLIMFVIFFLASIHFQTEKRVKSFFNSLSVAAVVLAIFELLNIFVGFGNLLPGFLNGVSYGNLVGSWSDFGLIFGIIVLLSIYSIEFLKTKKIYLIAQYFLLVTGIFFLILVNLPLVWMLVGIFSVIMFVYSISIQHAGINVVQGGEKRKRFPFEALIVVVFCFFFLLGSNSIGSFVSKYINIPNTDVRPSIVSTAQITYKALQHNPALGTGPNTFGDDWALWQPKQIVQTTFWNTNFSSGYSLFMTFIATTGILGFVALLLFIIIFVIRGIQSLKFALKNSSSDYYILTTLVVSVYSWVSIIVYNPSIIMLTLAFLSSGILIGILVCKQMIPVKEFSFLNDPRKSFFSIFGLMIVMIGTVFVVYLYINKFVSVIYFSKSLNAETTIESLSKSEKLLLNAISLDKNDIYYRTLSQVYINEISVLSTDQTISKDVLKTSLQQLVNLAQSSAVLAVDQNPKQYLNYMNLGNIYASFVPLAVEKSYESAVSAYDKARELAPNNPTILLSRAQLELANKNNAEAKRFINEAISIKQNYIDAIFLLAQIKLDEGDSSGAIEQAELASQLDPTDSTIFFRLGLLRYNSADYTGAVSAFEQAVILNTNYLNARFYLGQAYQKVGRGSDALVQYNLLKTVVPNDEGLQKAIDSVSGNQVSTPSTEEGDKTKEESSDSKTQNTKTKLP
ncbi:MAG TPA: hypothetical protein PKZ36_00430 [Candidatus Paceibacterota bacterium]|nr:hypothetical protein [Candidatus Paceibacterota bacterium]HPT17865.1 hypothetical protein [Candidatus Paceibacterota bacterium]